MVDRLIAIKHSTSYNGVAFALHRLHLASFLKLGILASTLDEHQKLLPAVCPINFNFGSDLTEKDNGISSPRIRLA